jgi:hypothetical protein
MATAFALTFDYLCPFARNVSESVVEGLLSGSAWDVRFRPFSLSQTKVDEGEVDVWDRPVGSEGTRGVLALQWGLAVRDGWSDGFHDFHLALFAARHEMGADISDTSVLAEVSGSVGLDPESVAAEIDSGRPLRTLQREHQDLVSQWGVFGVPTLIVGDEAVFVRSMERHQPDEIERLVDLIGWTNLNEFKRTRIPR